jgi:nicotinamide mononucleotide transporter PnuC
MNWLEIWGFITGAVCVGLQVKQNIWNWPIGIANNVLYVIVFWQSGLFADCGLQVLYIVISIYGFLELAARRGAAHAAEDNASDARARELDRISHNLKCLGDRVAPEDTDHQHCALGRWQPRRP